MISKHWQIRIMFLIILSFLFAYIKVPFRFLILNTFLAYIPIELGFQILRKSIYKTFWLWPFLIMWLLFYPNAPYLLTDLFHLTMLNAFNLDSSMKLVPIEIWIYFACLTIIVFLCVIISSRGLMNITQMLTNKYFANVPSKVKSFLNQLLIVLLTIISSIGIFIGRFLRIHTIFLFISPRLFINPLINMWHYHMIIFVIVLTIVQLSIDWVISIQNK
ncbi:DUF1361 domain-containing protein [Philodulcilactobacillus myokoensis]|uniref:DUF1361 domain-containing protein n=1 Tax=Philodulcilactobacillus myokoensis TaxID=2929573 RepID=UPI0025701AC1|nr:DUF1361 domain-containing protein [Philodulcilactobacillus myokoensis]